MSTHPENCSWIYQARRITTNTNAAGGAIIVDISISAGQVARLVHCYALSTTAGVHGLKFEVLDEDNGACVFGASIGAAAVTSFYLPTLGGSSGTSGNLTETNGLKIASGQKITISATGASGQANDTLQIYICLELFNSPIVPTWAKDRSTNAADCTIAASTISAANTLVAGRVWT